MLAVVIALVMILSLLPGMTALAVPGEIIITYDENGGNPASVPPPKTALENTVTALSSVKPTRTDYAFLGWAKLFDAETPDYQAGEWVSFDTNVTLYAVWKQSVYTITYAGTTIPQKNVSAESWTALSATTPTSPGRKFLYWATQPATQTYQPGDWIYVGNEDIVLYPIWDNTSWTVTFDPMDGTSPPYYTIEVLDGQLIDDWPDVSRPGYEGAGWYREATYDTQWIWNVDVVTEYTTLYAKWTQFVFHVEFYQDEPPAILFHEEDVDVHIKDTVNGKPGGANPEKEGHEFAGWYTWNDLTSAYDVPFNASAPITSDLIVVAKWEVLQYAIHYWPGDNSGAKIGTDYHDFGEIFDLPNEAIDRPGWTFLGWKYDLEGTAENYAPGASFTMPAEEVTLFAHWGQDEYEVTYDPNTSNSGTVPSDTNGYIYDADVTVLGQEDLTHSDPTYRFIGWSEKTTDTYGSATLYEPGDTFQIKHNTTLYAIWVPTYTVTYMANHHFPSISGDPADVLDPIRYVAGETATVLFPDSSFERSDGYAFVCWNTGPYGGGTRRDPGDEFVVGAANVTLYAIWAPTYRVTYNSNYFGSILVDVTDPGSSEPGYLAGTSVTALGRDTFTNDGYVFIRWDTGPYGHGTSYEADEAFVMPAVNLTLYAIWDVPSDSVWYDLACALLKSKTLVIPVNATPSEIETYLTEKILDLLDASGLESWPGLQVLQWPTSIGGNDEYFLMAPAGVLKDNFQLTTVDAYTKACELLAGETFTVPMGEMSNVNAYLAGEIVTFLEANDVPVWSTLQVLQWTIASGGNGEYFLMDPTSASINFELTTNIPAIAAYASAYEFLDGLPIEVPSSVVSSGIPAMEAFLAAAVADLLLGEGIDFEPVQVLYWTVDGNYYFMDPDKGTNNNLPLLVTLEV